MAKVRLYADPGAIGRVGIPVEGELFDAEDARRLVGQGIATRTRPDGPRAARKTATSHRAAARPAGRSGRLQPAKTNASKPAQPDREG